MHISNIFQPFRYVFPECDPPDEAVRLLAAICIGELSFLENNKDKETIEDPPNFSSFLN